MDGWRAVLPMRAALRRPTRPRAHAPRFRIVDEINQTGETGETAVSPPRAAAARDRAGSGPCASLTRAVAPRAPRRPTSVASWSASRARWRASRPRRRTPSVGSITHKLLPDLSLTARTTELFISNGALQAARRLLTT